LKEYRGISKLKKEALNVLVKLCNQDMLTDLLGEFRKIDKDQTGQISNDELKDALE
jgi:Ca2+-binding EF-hand superfamily protein